jgi:hypothetical protein
MQIIFHKYNTLKQDALKRRVFGRKAAGAERQIKGMPNQKLRPSATEATFFPWKSKYSGLELSDLKKMKSMEVENTQLKRIVADQALQINAMKEILQIKW